jgi:hypothetical protein
MSTFSWNRTKLSIPKDGVLPLNKESIFTPHGLIPHIPGTMGL